MVCKLPPDLRKVIERYKKCELNASPNYPASLKSDCRHNLHKEMDEARTEFLGSGISRRVFRFRGAGKRYGTGCVVKVAMGLGGTYANGEEATAWKELPAAAKRFFAPIDDADPDAWWLTQPLVDRDGEELATELEETLSSNGINCPDVHLMNVGYYKGDPVVFDYGEGVSCKVEGKGYMSVKELALNK